jgi:hypothetical protein
MATRKRKPRNADLVMPGLLDEPATVPKPSPDIISPSHSTGTHFEEKKQPEPPPTEKK